MITSEVFKAVCSTCHGSTIHMTPGWQVILYKNHDTSNGCIGSNCGDLFFATVCTKAMKRTYELGGLLCILYTWNDAGKIRKVDAT